MPYHPRRHARRQTVALPITLRESGTFVWARGTLLNLSEGGLQIHTHAKFEVGQKLEIEFSTSDESGRRQRRKMDAIIRWKQSQRYGCQFVRRRF